MLSPANSFKTRSPDKEGTFSSPKKITEIKSVEYVPKQQYAVGAENKVPSFYSPVTNGEPGILVMHRDSDVDSDDSIPIDLNIEEEEEKTAPEEVHLLLPIANGKVNGAQDPKFREKARAVTGRDTPEANNLLVQLICSQKDLKTPNWHDVVKAINSNPGDVNKPHGWDAELPVHWAISEKAPLFIIDALLDIYPDGASAKGRYGALPLWYAIETQGRDHEECVQLVKTLLDLFPQGAHKRLDHILPITKAHQLEAGEDIVYALLNCDLPYTDNGVPVCYHAFSWAWLLAETQDKYRASVERIMDAHPGIILELAKAVDQKGNVAVTMAHPLIKQLIYERAFFCGRYELMVKNPPIHTSSNSVVIRAMDYGAESSYLRVFSEHCTKLPDGEHSVIDSLAGLDVALQKLGSHMDVSKVDLAAVFSNCDDEKVCVSGDEFVRYCKTTFGSPREIAIKFMKSERLYEKERSYRKTCNLDGRYVVSLIGDATEASQGDISREISKSLLHLSFLNGFKFGCFMSCAKRDLLNIFHHDRLDRGKTSSIMRDVGQALQHLHSRGICHGNLRMRNVVVSNDRCCLVDLTGAANLEIFYIQDADVVGDQFVTGYLPPEMFMSLTPTQEHQVSSYWRSCEDYDEVWKRVRPVHFKHMCYCPRAFDSNTHTGAPRDLHALPYRPILASAQLDMWAYGLILFALSSGEMLLPVSSTDDLISPRDVYTAAQWTSDQLQERVDSAVADPLAADLIMHLLQPDPKDRPSTMKQVLDHVFFSAINNKRNSYIEQKIEHIYTEQTRRKNMASVSAVRDTDAMQTHKSPVPTTRRRMSNAPRDVASRFSPIRNGSPSIGSPSMRDDMNGVVSDGTGSLFGHVLKVDGILRRSLFETIDIRVPTCFVVVNQLLHHNDMNYNRDSISEEISFASDGGQKSAPVSAETAGRVRTAQRWYGYLADICGAVSEGDGGVDVVDKAVRGMFGEEHLYLYLVDEVTMLPLVPQPSSSGNSVYPIQIRDARSVIPRLLPLMKLSLQAIASNDDVSVFGRCFGFPPSSIPPNTATLLTAERNAEVDSSLSLPPMLDQAGLIRRDYSSESSQKDDETISKALSFKIFGDASEHASFQNHPLQALAKIFAKHDPSSDFSGLRRIAVQEDVYTWTAKNHIEKYLSMMALADEGDETKSPTPTSAQHRRDEESTPHYQQDTQRDFGAGTPLLLGRTVDGRIITAADLNNNILLCHEEILEVLNAVESLRSAERDATGHTRESSPAGGVAMDSCGCAIS